MAVRVSDATINHELNNNINNSTIDITSTGNQVPEYGLNDYFNVVVGSTVGLSENMVGSIGNAIDSYTNTIRTTLSRLENVESAGAFKGTGITEAVSTFVINVKDTANAYLDSLAESQKQMIESVRAAYEIQDADIAGDINSDGTTVSSARPQ